MVDYYFYRFSQTGVESFGPGLVLCVQNFECPQSRKIMCDAQIFANFRRHLSDLSKMRGGTTLSGSPSVCVKIGQCRVIVHCMIECCTKVLSNMYFFTYRRRKVQCVACQGGLGGMDLCKSTSTFGVSLSPYSLDLDLEVKSEVESEQEDERDNSLSENQSSPLSDCIEDEPQVEISGKEDTAGTSVDPLGDDTGQNATSVQEQSWSTAVEKIPGRKGCEMPVGNDKSITKALREVKRFPRDGRTIFGTNGALESHIKKLNIENSLSSRELSLQGKVDHCGSTDTGKKKLLDVPKHRRKRPNDKLLDGEDRGGEEFECADCGRKFPKKSHLATHLRAHVDVRRFRCRKCGSLFKTSANLQFHVATHSDVPFTCHVCAKTFPMRRALKRHIRIVHRTERFKCDQCDRCFKSSANLELHYTLHTGAKPHSCRPCSKSFVHKSTYAAHLRTHHLSECTKCDDKVKGVSPKVGGEDSQCPEKGGGDRSGGSCPHHNSGESPRPWLCTVCGKAYPHKGTLKNHMKTHEPEKPFKCDRCPKSFMKKQSYECHMKQHRGERPEFMCDQCSVAYFSAFALKRHYAKHVGARAFRCTVCAKAFWTNDALRVHQRTHTRIKAFVCTSCHRAFAHKHSLRAHVTTHSSTRDEPGDKRHECATCGKTFVHKYNLSRHERQHTNSQSL